MVGASIYADWDLHLCIGGSNDRAVVRGIKGLSLDNPRQQSSEPTFCRKGSCSGELGTPQCPRRIHENKDPLHCVETLTRFVCF